jgi:hypothetical protein
MEERVRELTDQNNRMADDKKRLWVDNEELRLSLLEKSYYKESDQSLLINREKVHRLESENNKLVDQCSELKFK